MESEETCNPVQSPMVLALGDRSLAQAEANLRNYCMSATNQNILLSIMMSNLTTKTKGDLWFGRFQALQFSRVKWTTADERTPRNYPKTGRPSKTL